jgi:methanogenic corrinoid protein MtbC1
MIAIESGRSRTAARFPVRELLRALLDGDDDAAMGLVRRVLAVTGSRTAVFADLLHPAQAEAGNLWYTGAVSAADEVRVAAAVRRIVYRLDPTPVARPVRRGSRCVVAVGDDDPHDVGVMMLVRALQDEGWNTEVLDPHRGLRDLVDLVTSRRPRLVCLSGGVMPPLPQVERVVSAVRRARVPVLLGGAAFNRLPHLWEQMGADGLGTDVRVGAVLARRLAGR